VARVLLERIAEDTTDVVTVESMPAFDGNSMVMILAPQS
jgi:translation initiation factor IF-3